MSGNLTKQINVSVDENTFKTLGQIFRKHKLSPPELTRGLLEEVCRFYEKHDWFSLPAVVEPEAFQKRYIEEKQASYGDAKTKSSKPPHGS